MTINPYVIFDGKCEEALRFYEKSLGAKVTMLMRYEESPMPTPIADKKRIMHSRLAVGDTIVMMADGPEGGKFAGFSLTLTVKDEAEAANSFDALKEGGTIKMPLAPTFFSRAFGMLTDRFGVGWMILAAPASP